MVLKELGKTPQLVRVLRRAALAGQREVVPVHGQDQVELVEVARGELARALGREVVAALRRVGLAAGVGRGADVVAVSARGVDQHPVAQPGLAHPGFKNAFRRRRAADVAHADEEHAKTCGRRGSFGVHVWILETAVGCALSVGSAWKLCPWPEG
ncbi:hypothetical protein FQZ97_830420 [compost metagenome]